MTGFNTQVGGDLYRIQIETDRKEVYDEIQRVARSFVDSEKVVVSKNENTTVAEKSSASAGVEELRKALYIVSTICAQYEPICGQGACPFWSETRGGCAVSAYRPDFWDTVDWRGQEEEK